MEQSKTSPDDLSTDAPGRSLEAVLGPPAPSFGVWEAVRPRLLLVIVSMLVFAGLGAAYVLIRQPKYTSTTTLAVIHVNFATPGSLGAFSTAGETLAATYARSIRADGVILPLAAAFHSKPGTIRRSLSAGAVPQTPVFTLTATSASPGRSVALANRAAQQLTAYLTSVNSSDPDAATLYKQLVKEEGNLATAQVNRTTVQSQIQAHLVAKHPTAPATAVMSDADQSALAKADAAVAVAQDQVNTLRTAYGQSIAGSSQNQFLETVQPASAASSDRNSRLELFVFAGAAFGLAFGVALAMFLHARRLRYRRF